MSNLIRYIIQEDPEKEMKKKNLDYSKYPTWGPTQKIRETSYKRSSFSPQNLLESVLSSNNTNQTPIPRAKKQNDINCKMSLQQNNSNKVPRYWDTEKVGKNAYDYVLQNEGKGDLKNQNILDYTMSAVKGATNIGKNFIPMKKMKVTDKFKHTVMNCNAAQFGKGGTDVAKIASDLREWYDVKSGSNTLDSSNADNYANKIGRFLGRKYPQGDCNEIIQKYIKKNW